MRDPICLHSARSCTKMTTGRRPFEGTGYAALDRGHSVGNASPNDHVFSPLTPPALEHVVEAAWQRILTSGGDRRGCRPRAQMDRKEGRTTRQTDTSRFTETSHLCLDSGDDIICGNSRSSLIAACTRQTDRNDKRTFHAVAARTRGISKYNQLEGPPVVSPDGRQIAFVAHEIGRSDLIWVRSLDRLAARALPGTGGVTSSVCARYGPRTADRSPSSPMASSNESISTVGHPGFSPTHRTHEGGRGTNKASLSSPRTLRVRCTECRQAADRLLQRRRCRRLVLVTAFRCFCPMGVTSSTSIVS